MSRAPDIAGRAVELAESFLEGARDELLAMADGDADALFEAAQIVRGQGTGQILEHSAEHLAFSLITAAFTQLRSLKTRSEDPGS